MNNKHANMSLKLARYSSHYNDNPFEDILDRYLYYPIIVMFSFWVGPPLKMLHINRQHYLSLLFGTVIQMCTLLHHLAVGH